MGKKLRRKGVSVDNELLEFVEKHLNCRNSQIKGGLREIAAPATIDRRLRDLITGGYLKKTSGGTYIRENPDRHPDDQKQREINIARERDMERLEEAQKKVLERMEGGSELVKLNAFIKDAIMMNTSVQISPPGIYFSHQVQEYFEELLFSLLEECFFNNPDVWQNFPQSKDLHFGITITANWEKDPRIWEAMERYKQVSLENGFLHRHSHILVDRFDGSVEEQFRQAWYGTSRAQENQEKKEKDVARWRENAIQRGNRDPETLHSIARGEAEKRREIEDDYRKRFPILKAKYVAIVEAEMAKLKQDSPESISLANLKDDIERGYYNLEEGEVELIWDDFYTWKRPLILPTVEKNLQEKFINPIVDAMVPTAIDMAQGITNEVLKKKGWPVLEGEEKKMSESSLNAKIEEIIEKIPQSGWEAFVDNLNFDPEFSGLVKEAFRKESLKKKTMEMPKPEEGQKSEDGSKGKKGKKQGKKD